MPPEAGHPIAVVFLGDLRLVSALGGLGAYLAWLLAGAEAGAGLGRLALTVAWLATGGILYLGGVDATPMRDWVLLGGLGLYLGLGFGFTLSALGWLVSLGTLALAAVPYVASPLVGAPGTLPELARYWATWRDIAAAAAVAMAAMAVAGGLMRAAIGDRRVGQAMAPNDLLAASRLLGNAAAFVAAVGAVAAVFTLRQEGVAVLPHALRFVGLSALAAGAVLWLRYAGAGEGPPWRLALVAAWNAAACALILAGARLTAYLTPPAGAP